MSAKYYAKLWVTCCSKILEIIAEEKKIQVRIKIPNIHLSFHRNVYSQEYGTVSQPLTAHTILVELYVRYILILNDLSDIFDQILQVQKKELVKRALISVINRVCELKRKLCEIEMSEYVYIDSTFISAHLTPHDIAFRRPNFFPMKRPKEYSETIDKYLEQSKSASASERTHRLDSINSMKSKPGTYLHHLF